MDGLVAPGREAFYKDKDKKTDGKDRYALVMDTVHDKGKRIFRCPTLLSRGGIKFTSDTRHSHSSFHILVFGSLCNSLHPFLTPLLCPSLHILSS